MRSANQFGKEADKYKWKDHNEGWTWLTRLGINFADEKELGFEYVRWTLVGRKSMRGYL